LTLTKTIQCRKTCLWNFSLVFASLEGWVECNAHDCRWFEESRT